MFYHLFGLAYGRKESSSIPQSDLVMHLDKYGETASASIAPQCLEHLFNKIQRQIKIVVKGKDIFSIYFIV